ncbi:hypothetical protein HPB48_014309 [Haemaphysalis longicornis]|uniref:Uncharacterized protein n=1 Tax=Haemaphysalis longicornis TaxID=44386 RepID=A0A9J6FIR5_HAELO|nr:hypothetical protein HPB48_014309 [Haemaphysalis longicornis]
MHAFLGCLCNQLFTSAVFFRPKLPPTVETALLKTRFSTSTPKTLTGTNRRMTMPRLQKKKKKPRRWTTTAPIGLELLRQQSGLQRAVRANRDLENQRQPWSDDTAAGGVVKCARAALFLAHRLLRGRSTNR